MNRFAVISARAVIVQTLHNNIVEEIKISPILPNSQPDLVTAILFSIPGGGLAVNEFFDKFAALAIENLLSIGAMNFAGAQGACHSPAGQTKMGVGRTGDGAVF